MQVKAAAAQVSALSDNLGGLDGLINNAGIMGVPDNRTADGFDVQVSTGEALCVSD